MAYADVPVERLEIDGVPLNCAGWTHTNLWALWAGATTRGTDRIIPGATGILSKPRRATAARLQLAVEIFGHIAWDGTPYADHRLGLWTNVDHLRTNVTDPVTTGDGTRTGVLYLPDGSTLTGPVTVEGFQLGDSEGVVLTSTIDLTIPAGALS